MNTATITCPRCFKAVELNANVRFCPHCGLADVKEAALDHAPVEVLAGRRKFHVYDRLAIGSICTVYRCRFEAGLKQVEGVFKVARDPRSNHLLINEATILRELHQRDRDKRLGPFIPAVEESIAYSGNVSEDARQANILRMHDEIRSPDELYTLAEVQAQYPGGVESRDMAWIWRRLLTVLGFAHSNTIVHGAVLPMHILIEPREHKLMLVDWCAAIGDVLKTPRPALMLDHGYERWFRRAAMTNQFATPALDIAFAARCMIELLGGEPLAPEFPANVEPALQRYFQRCLAASDAAPNALKLLEDFDQLIEALWGPRQFRVFNMPAKIRT